MAHPVPSLDQLLALPTDRWSQLLAEALPVVRALPDDQRDAAATRMATVPPGRLVGGRPRERFAAIVRRPAVWSTLAARLDAEVLAALDGAGPTVEADEDGASELRARLDAAIEEAGAATQRASDLRDRLDEARRAADGATARAAAAEERAAAADRARADAEAVAAELRAALDGAAAEQHRAVERERRRAAARDDRERDELSAARRTVAGLRDEVATLSRRLEAARREVARGAGVTPRPTDDASPSGGRRGRPSALPAGVTPRTREAASWLVAAGVPLLVDGYNVSRTQRPAATFADQRRWLEDAVAALAQRRGLPATIVWDSSAGASTQRSRAGLTVRYTTDEMTADDELVLHVRTLLDPDEPVVVVTDDAELRGRLAELRVDLLDTTSFTWLLR